MVCIHASLDYSHEQVYGLENFYLKGFSSLILCVREIKFPRGSRMKPEPLYLLLVVSEQSLFMLLRLSTTACSLMCLPLHAESTCIAELSGYSEMIL